MRLLALALLVTVPAAAAQTAEPALVPPPPDSTHLLPELTTAELLGEAEPAALPDAPPRVVPYSAFDLSAGWSGSAGLVSTLRGSAGAELASGLRLGGTASVTTSGAATTVAAGPEIGYRRALGGGYALRARGVGAVSVTSGTSAAQGTTYGSRTLGVGGSLGVERELPLVGSVRLAPRAGVYGTLGRRSAVPQFDLDARTVGSAGLLLGTDVRFRAFGRDWSVPLVAPVEILGGAGRGLSPLTFGVPAY